MAQVIVILLLAVIGLFTMAVAFNEVEDAIAAPSRSAAFSEQPAQTVLQVVQPLQIEQQPLTVHDMQWIVLEPEQIEVKQ